MELASVLSTRGGCGAFASGVVGSGDSANSKRKLDCAHAPTKMVQAVDSQPKVRRRGSSVTNGDGGVMKRCYSDGTISEALGALIAHATDSDHDSETGACPKSPSMMVLNSAQKKHISPRVGHYSPICHRSSFAEDTCPARSTDVLSPTARPEADCSFGSDSGVASVFPRSASSDSLPLNRPPSIGTPRNSELATLSSSERKSKPSLSIDMDFSLSRNAATTTPTLGRSTSLPKRTWQPQRKNRNPGNLSLDLSQMDQPTFDPCEGVDARQFRRTDQAAVCSRVTDFLFVGGAAAAKDRDTLLKCGITHIINCAASVTPDFYPQDFLYYNVRLRDHSSQDIARHFYNIFDFIEGARRRGGKIFVHCVKGISRSPTMAIAYLMWYKRIGLYKALDFVRQARPVVDPNAGFIFQLTEWEHLHMEGTLRFQKAVVFRIEVPRDATGNGNGSRAAEKPLIIGPLTSIGEDYFHRPTKEIAKSSFVVSCADCMYIWCGAEVSEVQLEAAQHAIVLLQRYESFPEKCEIVYHGQEGASFWNLVDALNSK